jgi:XRE family aerobic/anaerobic benzoate catabolism transcriptional regulator
LFLWLKARPDEHMKRVRKQGDLRPRNANPKAMKDLRSILTSRESLYAQAEAVVDTSGRSLQQSKKDLVEVIRKLEVL